jgi:hypothetical protein
LVCTAKERFFKLFLLSKELRPELQLKRNDVLRLQATRMLAYLRKIQCLGAHGEAEIKPRAGKAVHMLKKILNYVLSAYFFLLFLQS